MNITDRDRKILLGLIPIVVLLAYFFLLLNPKRQEAAKAGEELAKQEQARDDARAKLTAARSAKATFTGDYTAVVRLGKAVPSSVDMPSLLVQLDSAADGTGIHFTKVETGERQESQGGSGAQPPAGGPNGGSPQSTPGQQAQKAQNATSNANQSSANRESAAGNSGVDAKTSESSKQGGLPVGGGTTSGAAAQGGSGVPGLDSVPLEFEFSGDFFSLSDFFHDVKRFVHVANDRVLVSGRLMVIDGLKFTTDPETFPRLKAEVKATVYLAPRAEGTTAGATPSGPSTVPAGGAAPSSAPGNSTTPTATTTP